MRQVDARLALIRYAVFAEAGPPRVSPLQRRKSRAMEPEPISDECCESYDYDFAERVGIKMDSGLRELCGSKSIMPDCCAYHSTLLELGCVEFYDWEKKNQFVRGMVRVGVSLPDPVTCSRCESVGHDVVSCPFGLGDVDAMKIARLRRERRGLREAAA